LAKCSLDTSKPKFRRCIADHLTTHPALQSGLDELGRNLLKDHKLCGWVNHPMPGFPKYQNKVWKWDFKPQAVDPSGTRKGWRLFAYVPDPDTLDPVTAIAFFCYPKKQEPGGNPATWIAKALKSFLVEEVDKGDIDAEKFRRFKLPDGQIRSLCCVCFETIFVSEMDAEIEMAERSHICATNNSDHP